jgi:hypothetical protein
MGEPQATGVGWSSLGLLVNHEFDLIHLVGPNLFALQQINVHEFDDFVYHIDVHFSELPIFINQFCCLLLNCLGVAFNLGGVCPSDEFLGR